jgi:hypothetical protein
LSGLRRSPEQLQLERDRGRIELAREPSERQRADGVIEILAGVAVALKPRYASYVVAGSAGSRKRDRPG